MTGQWVLHDIRDQVVDFINYWHAKTAISLVMLIAWVGLSRSKFHYWRVRYGTENKHNGQIPRDFWLEDWERQAIIDFYHANPNQGYRRLTYMMMDAGIVAVSPSTVRRILHDAGLLTRWKKEKSTKGKGFVQPLKPHEHWHTDISYININGTFYYLCSLLDGCSRYIVHWEIRESMTEADVEVIIQRGKELFPKEKPRIISDNGPQFLSKDFKEFIRISGMTHVRTSPYYPQSNGKMERFHKTIKQECIRPKTPLSVEDARRLVTDYVNHYNTVRLHSALGYVAPLDKLKGREKIIHNERDSKLENARLARKARRQKMRSEQKTEPQMEGNTL